jgi:integrase/recombinase XerD
VRAVVSNQLVSGSVDEVRDRRHRLLGAVVLLSGLPQLDPADRYDLRLVTAAWLETDKTDTTRVAYFGALQGWLSWCEGRELDPLAARRVDVDAWKNTATTKGAAPGRSTVRLRVSAVSSWYDYLASNDLTDRNPAKLAGRPRPVDPDPTALSPQECGALLATAHQRAEDLGSEPAWRTTAVITVMLETALRVSSVIGADVADLRETGLRYTAKGGKSGEKDLTPQAVALLRRYLARRGEREGAPPTGALFVTTGGVRLTRRDVWNTIRSTAERAGITTRITPHVLRATAVTTLLDLGMLAEAQDLADHADPRTTRRNYDARNRSAAGHARLASVLNTARDQYRASRGD